MTISKLADGYIEAKYYGSRSNNKVCKITPHHMTAHWTGKRCAEYFTQANKGKPSANYCIGYDGDIWCSVPEEYRAYTSANFDNDSHAITIECANSSLNYPYPISEATWNSLVNLCVDICERYDFRLNYNGNPSGSLTMHRWFANTDCPGDYLAERFDELEKEVNSRLDQKNILKIQDIADLDLYYDVNKDVARAYGRDDQKLWEHLINFGVKEGRLFSYVYDPKYYAKINQDVQKAYGNDYTKILNHYLGAGAREGRQSSIEFDVKYYMEKNKDLQNAKFNYLQATKHFVTTGLKEWRETSPTFNVRKYREYKDLQNAFKDDCKKYYKHYLIFGQNEGRKAT